MQSLSYNNGEPPSSVYLTSLHVTKSDRPSPPLFLLQVIKNWRWERPGNVANISLLQILPSGLKTKCTAGQSGQYKSLVSLLSNSRH